MWWAGFIGCTILVSATRTSTRRACISCRSVSSTPRSPILTQSPAPHRRTAFICTAWWRGWGCSRHRWNWKRRIPKRFRSKLHSKTAAARSCGRLRFRRERPLWPLMDILFIADPLDHFKIYKDTTYAMMAEAARRGHTLYACEPQHLAWVGGKVEGTVQRGKIGGDDADRARSPWYEAAAPEVLDLKHSGAVLMRKDPP